MKNIYRFIAFSILLLASPRVFSSHIVGGALTYTYNGGNNYTVQLLLYRDCSGAAFPGSAAISVFQADGSLFTTDRSFTLPGGTITNIPPVLPPCATSPSVLPCVEQRVYTATVNLAPSPGGMHLVYSLCCRNPAINNIVSPGTTGETFYAFIPCYTNLWAEDFTLANGTTSDAGTTAWTRTLGTTPPTSAQVNNGQFEIIGSNNGSMMWSSQVINISAYTSGVNLSANLSKAGANFGNNDTLRLYYSINSGPLTVWPVNGSNVGNWASPRFATATGLIGNTIQIYIRTKFNSNNNSTGKTFDVDMVSVYDNTFMANSSPAYVNLPPLLLCATNSFTLNHSASDADGDVLVYSMYDPYNDAPAPTFPNNTLSVNTITWTAGYSATTPFNSGGPGVTLNASTGIMTGVANSLGQYVFGVKCQEYRGGILLSEMVRDYQVKTVTCPPFVPSAPIATANTPLCAGQTLNLSATFTAGAVYNWTGPNGFSSTSINPSIPNVTTLAAGIYSVTATVSGCTSPPGTVQVVVNPTPATPTVSSNSPLCAGQTLSLSSSTVASATYSWSGPNSFSSSLQNPTLPGASTLAAGVYTLNVTVSGCTSANATTNVVINNPPPPPVAGSNSPLCIGSTITLTASTVAGATYSWTGPAGFTSTSQNPSITGATAANAGTYSVVANVGGCIGAAGTTTVTISPTPPTPTVSNNSPICEFQTLNLTASTIAGATYNWSGPNSFSSSLQNPTVPGATTLAAGVYSVSVTVGGCTGATGTTTVTINSAPPAPVAGSNSPLCIGQNINLTASPVGGATYSWTGPNSFTSTAQNPVITGASTVATGVYSVVSIVAGCTSITSTVSVLMSAPAIISTGGNQTVCANNANVSLNGTSSTGSGTWTSSGGGSFSPNTLTGVYVPSAADISGGAFTLTLTSTNNGGCAAVSNQMTVSVSPAPTSNAGPNKALCANNATLALSGSVTVASGGTWSSSGTGTFTPNNTSLNTSYIPSAADISAGSVTFTLTTSGNGNCLPVTDTVKIVFFPSPVVSGGPNQQYVCKNNPNYTLNGTSTTGSVTWSTLGSGAFNPNNNILNPTYIPSTADTTAGSVFLIVASTNNGTCNQVKDTIQLIYTSTITISAGASQTVCANNPSVALSGTCTTGFGTWTTSGSGTFSPNTLTGNYIPSAADISAGVVTLTVTSGNNGTCLPITSTVNIYISPGPVANAGPDQTVCANNGTVTLSGSFTLATGGVWSSSGTGTFTPNTTNMGASYIPSAADTTAGSVKIILTTTGNGNCFPARDTMKIFFTPAPLVNAGANIAVCRNNPVATLNGYSSTGTGTWTTLGSGAFSPSSSVLNPTYTPSTADTTAGSVLLVLTSTNNGGCNPVRDTVKIIYSAIPTVSAGVSQTVCANNATIALNGVSSTGSGTWTASGTGTFAPNTATGNYVPSPADIGAGSITFTLTSTNNGGCVAVSSQMSVAVSPAPGSNAGPNQTVCANNASITLNGAVTIATGGTWSSMGTGTFTPNNTSLNTGYLPSAADTAAGSVNIILTTTGNGNCLAVRDTMKLIFTPAPFVNAGPNIVVCNNATVFNLNATCSTGSGTWTSSGSGAFTPGNNVLNPTYTASGGDVSAGSVILVLTSTNNGSCNANRDSLTISFQSKPVANFGAASKCLNVVTTFTDLSTISSGTITSWHWNFGASTSTVQNASTTFTTPGSHTVSLVVSNGGCKDSIAKAIYINPLPTASFTPMALCHDSARFTDNSMVAPGSIQSWNWNFGDTTFSTQQNPYHLYADTGMYVIHLTVTSDSGCVASASDTIYIHKCGDDLISNPAVPGGFTPNGDGLNDVLLVKGGPFNSMSFRLFNEWGNQIFSSETQATGWDGTYKSATQPAGRYIWTLTGEVKDGRKINMAGEVILSR